MQLTVDYSSLLIYDLLLVVSLNRLRRRSNVQSRGMFVWWRQKSLIIINKEINFNWFGLKHYAYR